MHEAILQAALSELMKEGKIQVVIGSQKFDTHHLILTPDGKIWIEPKFEMEFEKHTTSIPEQIQ